MKVLYKPGETNIRTTVTTGDDGKHLCSYTGESVAPLIDQGYILAEMDDILPQLAQAQRQRWCGPWLEISADEWYEALGCLPPEKWLMEEGREMFRMSEYTSGCITAHYARVGERYFCAQREIGAEYSDMFFEIENTMKGEEYV